MVKNKFGAHFFIIGCFLWMAGSAVQADHLTTGFFDVFVDNVPLGSAFPLQKPSQRSLVLTNRSDRPIRIRVTVLRPSPSDLRHGAEAIPDVSWIHVEPSELVVASNQEGEAKLTVTVPKKRAFRRKHFQVSILSQTVPASGSGLALSAGLLSRVRFKTQ